MTFLAAYLARGPLSRLSCNKDCYAPTNADRARALGLCAEPRTHNTYPWEQLRRKQAGDNIIKFRRSA